MLYGSYVLFHGAAEVNLLSRGSAALTERVIPSAVTAEPCLKPFRISLPSALPCLRPKCHMHVSHGSGCLLLQSPIIRALKTPQREESAGSVDLLHPLTHARLCQYRISMPVEPSAACQVEVEWRSKGCRRDTDNSESQRGISKYRCALDASSRRSLERDISILIQIKDRMTRG